MKKSFLMLGLAVAAMTSCTNDEVLEQNQSTQKAIGFETFVNKGTRTISETTNPALDGENAVTGLKKFYVYGYHGNVTDFNGATVSGTYDANSTDNPKIKWTHTGETKYWANGTYYFAAYANGNSADAWSNVSFANQILTIPNYSVSYTTGAQTATTTDAPDLVAAIKTETGTMQRTAKVNFTFKHLLTKIKFHIVNNNTQGLTVDITDVVVSNVKNTGTFASTYAADWAPAQTDWTPSGSAVANFIPIAAQSLAAKNANGTDDEVTSDDFYVIPQALTAVDGGIKVTFTANYKQGSSIVSTQNVDLYLNKDSHTSWTPGYSYVYTIGLPQSATPIVFGTPSVTTWADGGTITLQ